MTQCHVQTFYSSCLLTLADIARASLSTYWMWSYTYRHQTRKHFVVCWWGVCKRPGIRWCKNTISCYFCSEEYFSNQGRCSFVQAIYPWKSHTWLYPGAEGGGVVTVQTNVCAWLTSFETWVWGNPRYGPPPTWNPDTVQCLLKFQYLWCISLVYFCLMSWCGMFSFNL